MALVGLGFGGGFLTRGRPELIEAPPAPQVPKDQAAIDRMMNPLRLAAQHWTESEDQIGRQCLAASDALAAKGKQAYVSVFAYLLTNCGQAEQAWRGKEKCQGSAFAINLFAEMLDEGTPEEDAARIVVKLHRLKPNGRQDLTAEDCLRSRLSGYAILKASKITSRAKGYDQMLKMGHMIQGNKGFEHK